MNRVTITLHIDLPDGVIPDVSYGTPPVVAATMQTMDEPPLPKAPPPDLFQEAARIFNDPDPDVREYQQKAAVMAAQPAVQAARSAAAAPVCAIHGNTMKRWPAGTSKKTGKSFNPSWRCSVTDCTTKPIWDRDAA